MKDLKQERWMNLFQNLVLCTILGITGQIITAAYSFMNFAQTFLLTFCIGFTVSSWVPVNQIGEKFSKMMGFQSETAQYVITNILAAIIITTIMTSTATFIRAGENFYQLFMVLYFPFIVVSAFTGIITSNPILKFVKKYLV